MDGEMNNSVLVTIFTPTYNRKNMIMRLYESLTRQTCKNFEWMVVDDGRDETDVFIDGLKVSNREFSIKYIRKNDINRGIGRAMNDAVKLANGRLFMKVDDDDMLSDDAIEKIIYYEKTIHGHKEYAGVAGLRCHFDKKQIGSKWRSKKKFIDATNLERKKYGLDGDKAEAYYTDVLKKCGPMPVVTGENYTWEEILWDKIAHEGYKIRWFNEVIYFCDYLPDGTTAAEKKAKYNNFETYSLLVKQKISYDEVGMIDKLKLLCRYFEIARTKEIPFKQCCEKISSHTMLVWISFCASRVTSKLK